MDVQRHIGRLKAFLKRSYGPLIDTSDLAGRHEDPERSFLSRAQAAMALEVATGMPAEQAAASVTDDFADRGMDAIGVDTSSHPPRIVIVQSKWKTGSKSLSERDILAWKQGLELLRAGKYDRMNALIRAREDEISAALHAHDTRVTLVPVLPTSGGLPPSVVDSLQNLCDDFNEISGYEAFLWAPMGLEDLIGFVDRSAEPERPTLHARLNGASWHAGPISAVEGTLDATVVAEWFDDKRYDLFLRNVRNPLGMTEVNQEIVGTLQEQPEYFWYLNHGITVSCDRIKPSPRGGDLELTGASVIDGAQTVASIHHAYRQSPELVDRASLRAVFVSSEGTEPGFVRRLVRGKNRQNGTEAQDFIADQPEQAQLRKDFASLLGKTYVLRRGEEAPAQTEGCDLLEAARALACSHISPAFAHRATDPWKLWTEETYPELFTARTDAFRVWRAVAVLRGCTSTLDKTRKGLRGRALTVADNGAYLVAHLVFRQCKGWERCSEDEWRKLLQSLPHTAETALRWVLQHIDNPAAKATYIGAIFSNERRFVDVARQAAIGLVEGAVEPTLASDYIRTPPKKRPFASHVIVDREAIAPGTTLEFTPLSAREKAVLSPWLAQDPRRARATWVNSRSRYLLWEEDGERYSANNLYKLMFHRAGAPEPTPRQCTALWNVPGRGSLAQIADALLREQEEAG